MADVLTPTASAIDDALACVGSVLLPQYPEATDRSYADRGTAIHRYLETVDPKDPGPALAQVPDEHRDECASIPLEHMPVGSKFQREVALAYNLETGETDVMTLPAPRAYPRERRTWPWVSGTVDSAVDDDGALVWDYKTGHLVVRNTWQIRFAMLAWSAVAGRDSAIGQNIHLGDCAHPWRETFEARAWQLECWREELRARLHAVVHAQRPTLAQLHHGDQCHYCSAAPGCPKQHAMIRQAAGGLVDAAAVDAEVLHLGDVAKAYEMGVQLAWAGNRMKQAAIAYAAKTPVPLSNGLVLGPRTVVKKSVDGEVAHAAVLDWARGQGARDPNAIADAAVSFTGTQAGLKRAADEAKAQGVIGERDGAKTVDLLLTEVARRGGLHHKPETRVEPHKPEPKKAIVGGD